MYVYIMPVDLTYRVRVGFDLGSTPPYMYIKDIRCSKTITPFKQPLDTGSKPDHLRGAKLIYIPV